MRIAREEIFGPVLGVLKWSDEAKMLEEVNSVEYGLTCSIWTNDISTAHRTAAAVEAGFVWINEVGKHFLGVPFGGVKQSGIGREEGFEEMLAFTQEKNIHVQAEAAADVILARAKRGEGGERIEPVGAGLHLRGPGPAPPSRSTSPRRRGEVRATACSSRTSSDGTARPA